MQLIEEIKQQDIHVLCTLPHVYFTSIEDNSGDFKLVRLPNMRFYTKHIAMCHHPFREHVCHRKVKIFAIDTNDQPADIATKAVDQGYFTRHYKKIFGR